LFRLLLRFHSKRRSEEAESKNDREPDPSHRTPPARMAGGSLAEGLSFGSTMPAGQRGGDSRPPPDPFPDDLPCIHNEAHCLTVPRWAPSRMTTRCAVVTLWLSTSSR